MLNGERHTFDVPAFENEEGAAFEETGDAKAYSNNSDNKKEVLPFDVEEDSKSDISEYAREQGEKALVEKRQRFDNEGGEIELGLYEVPENASDEVRESIDAQNAEMMRQLLDQITEISESLTEENIDETVAGVLKQLRHTGRELRRSGYDPNNREELKNEQLKFESIRLANLTNLYITIESDESFKAAQLNNAKIDRERRKIKEELLSNPEKIAELREKEVKMEEKIEMIQAEKAAGLVRAHELKSDIEEIQEQMKSAENLPLEAQKYFEDMIVDLDAERRAALVDAELFQMDEVRARLDLIQAMEDKDSVHREKLKEEIFAEEKERLDLQIGFVTDKATALLEVIGTQFEPDPQMLKQNIEELQELLKELQDEVISGELRIANGPQVKELQREYTLKNEFLNFSVEKIASKLQSQNDELQAHERMRYIEENGGEVIVDPDLDEMLLREAASRIDIDVLKEQALPRKDMQEAGFDQDRIFRRMAADLKTEVNGEGGIKEQYKQLNDRIVEVARKQLLLDIELQRMNAHPSNDGERSFFQSMKMRFSGNRELKAKRKEYTALSGELRQLKEQSTELAEKIALNLATSEYLQAQASVEEAEKLRDQLRKSQELNEKYKNENQLQA